MFKHTFLPVMVLMIGRFYYKRNTRRNMRILFKIFIVSFIIHKIRDTFLNIRAMNVGCFTHVWFMKIHFHCFFFYIFSSEYSFHQAEEKSVSHKDQLIRPVNNRTTVSFRVNSSKDGINEKLNLKKIAHEKPRLISFKGLLSNWQKKERKKKEIPFAMQKPSLPSLWFLSQQSSEQSKSNSN